MIGLQNLAKGHELNCSEQDATGGASTSLTCDDDERTLEEMERLCEHTDVVLSTQVESQGTGKHS
jgi:hypothetical protein